MPTINRPKKTDKRTTKEKSTKVQDIYKTVYNTTRWRNLRIWHLMQFPLCEYCLKNLATEVHHIKEISSGNSIEEYEELGFDEANLKSICSQCHTALHADKHKEKKKN